MKKSRKVEKLYFDKPSYLKFAKECRLTRRETEIGIMVIGGLSNKRIAEELFISETTVKKHLTHIYEKTEIYGRKALKNAFLRLP